MLLDYKRIIYTGGPWYSKGKRNYISYLSMVYFTYKERLYYLQAHKT